MKQGRKETDTTRRDAPFKWETRTSTPSLLMLKRLIGFPTYENVERQSMSVHCAEINSANSVISAFWFSVMPAITQTSRRKGTKGPLCSLMNSGSVILVCGAHARKFWYTATTRMMLSSAILALPSVLRRDSASTTWCLIPARWTMSNPNS